MHACVQKRRPWTRRVNFYRDREMRLRNAGCAIEKRITRTRRGENEPRKWSATPKTGCVLTRRKLRATTRFSTERNRDKKETGRREGTRREKKDGIAIKKNREQRRFRREVLAGRANVAGECTRLVVGSRCTGAWNWVKMNRRQDAVPPLFPKLGIRMCIRIPATYVTRTDQRDDDAESAANVFSALVWYTCIPCRVLDRCIQGGCYGGGKKIDTQHRDKRK